MPARGPGGPASGDAGTAGRLLLFDIDGTLVATGGAGRRALQAAGRAVFGDGFSVEGLDPSGKLDPAIVAELAARHPHLDLAGQATRFHDAYVAALRGEAASMRPLPGAQAAVAALASIPDVTLGILTGNARVTARWKLAVTGLAAPDGSPFAVHSCGDEAPDRAGLVALALARYRSRFGRALAPDAVALVGDTPRDVAAGRAHGVRVFGVATGRWDADALAAAGADAVLPDLRDPAPLRAWAGMPGRG